MSRIIRMFWKEWHNYDSSNSFISICKIIKLNIIWVILLKFQFVQFANAACAFDNLELSGTCYPCNTIVPAWQQCDYNGCLSCSEGLYLVVDKQVWVESWDLAIIPSTDANQSKYFARRNSRKWYRCGVEWANCFDELGWTDIFQDPTLTDSTSMLVSVGDGNAKTAKLWSDVITGWKRCNTLRYKLYFFLILNWLQNIYLNNPNCSFNLVTKILRIKTVNFQYKLYNN